MAVYKKRLLTAKPEQDQGDPSLKNRYEKKEKEELTIQRKGFLKLRSIYLRVIQTMMGIFAMIGVIALLRPELRSVMIELLVTAVRELQGF